MSDPIVVDIGAAMQTLEANPDLARKMNELVLGPVIAEQLAAREALINTLGEALQHLTVEAQADGMEAHAGWDCWISNADKALAEFRKYTGQETTT
ncbi:hypothetical protein [Endobacterium cereale]|uniref:hypothetical protein n=1 Tax=Endobacterium cereale TaxID=2663029 RepID=UPI002B487B78|nr:hypothetical protein [Endobacterium cereale]MEB2845950.1 hypothetical protein [Endobacterium cereale]